MTKPQRKQAQAPSPVRRRPRRSTAELHVMLVEAAAQEFAENGYAGARTAAIAQRAGVVEPLLFKYFGSKANLFQRAIFEKLDGHYRNFVETHDFDREDPSKWAEQSSEYVSEQQDFLRRNSRMFMSLILHEAYDSREVEGIDGLSGLQAFLDKMSEFASARFHDRPDTDPRLIARISFASLLACVLFSDWLFPEGMASEDKIRAAVIDFILKGSDLDPSRIPAVAQAADGGC